MAVEFANGKSFDAAKLELGSDEFDALVVSFKEIDLDGNGWINASEVGSLLDRMGIPPGLPEDLDTLVQSVDPDGSGRIDFGEFGTIIRTVKEKEGERVSGSDEAAGGASLALSSTANLRAFVKALELKRDELAREGKLVAAISVQKEVDKMYETGDKMEKRDMFKRQHDLTTQVEMTFEEEIAQVTKIWDDKIKGYLKHVEKAVVELKAKHHQEMVVFQNQMAARAPKSAPPSKEILEAKSRYESLVAQKFYEEALSAQRKYNDLTLGVFDDARIKFEQRVAVKTEKKRAQMQLELDGILKKAESGRQELERRRDADLDRRRRRFQNVNLTLTTSQRKEAKEFDIFATRAANVRSPRTVTFTQLHNW